jgi:hypothetical protein
MSEYQRYEFMTQDRPLTRAELGAVNALSSHIDVSSTHAVVEYSWGNFKHNPIDVLYKYFDGFLYWANWGSPRLALRFPHGMLPADLLEGYDLDDVATFTRHPDYDILDIQFGELEAPDEWVEYELGSLIGVRDELMDGDLRPLYIVWLANQASMGSYDEEEEYEIDVPPVPPGMGKLTSAQQALAELFRMPEELLIAAARHSKAAAPKRDDDVAVQVKLLSPERRDEYLARLARNEPGLSRLLVKELRDLAQQRGEAPPPPTGERVTYATLLKESEAIREQMEREERERQRLAHERHLRDIHEHQSDYWQRADEGAARGSGTGYDESVKALSELREVAQRFQETQQFQERFRAWVVPHMRRPALVKRLQDHQFPLPQV